LIDNNLEDKRLGILAGMAYFATNDFDNAEKYLKQAQQDGILDQRNPQLLRYLQTIPYYKEQWKRELAFRQADQKKGNLPKVKITTSQGDIVIELFEDQAPIATANFISLVDKKFYDGTKFHRVIPGFMAQGGDPKGDGSGGPGYTIPCECTEEDARMHFRGTLSMAHAGTDTG